jgi:hypothetical protein
MTQSLWFILPVALALLLTALALLVAYRRRLPGPIYSCLFWPRLAIARVVAPPHLREVAQISDLVFFGPVPTSPILRVIQRAGVQTVVNLQAEYAGPVRYYLGRGIEQVRVRVVDFHSPSLSQIKMAVDIIEQSAEVKNMAVYVHCFQGHGRSAVIAFCYLVKTTSLTCHQIQNLLESRRSVRGRLYDDKNVKRYIDFIRQRDCAF